MNCFFSADVDFVSLTRELTFDANTTVIPVEITINNDNFFEEFFENFTVSLTRNPDDPMDEVIIDPEEATVLIQDDEGKLMYLLIRFVSTCTLSE